MAMIVKVEPVIEPLDLDKVLGKPKNRVTKIGVELEGGWIKLPVGAKLERDSSVFNDAPPAGHKAGELPLGPMQVAQLGSSMRKYYPQAVDATCGMHVHMSFETLFQYNLLADSPVYQETVMEYLLRWAKEEGFKDAHHIWPRLKGQSIYAQKKYWPQEQMQRQQKDHDKERYGHRYTAIHYCWNRYGTVECRILPMMETVEQGIRATRRVIDITNAYLILADRSKARRTAPSRSKVEMDFKSKGVYDERGKDYTKMVFENGDIYEEYIEAKL
jgi:hypothetical protein